MLEPLESIHNYLLMHTLITNDGREEATSSQIQGSHPSTFCLWHHSQLIVHYTNPVPHMGAGQWMGAKPVFCWQAGFFKTTNEI
jgi:hypothetical protein